MKYKNLNKQYLFVRTITILTLFSLILPSTMGFTFFEINDSDENIFNHSPGELIAYMSSSIGTTLAAIDYDNNGDMDFLESARDYIIINTNKQGNYEKTEICKLPGRHGYCEDLNMGEFAVGDFDNDGQEDFLSGGVQGVIRLFVNNNSQPGKPHFHNFTVLAEYGQCAWGIAVADFNKDGWLDFAASHTTSPLNYSTITLFYNQGNLTFKSEDIYYLDNRFIYDLEAGDFDNDGDIDLLYSVSNFEMKFDGWATHSTGEYVLIENDASNKFSTDRTVGIRGHDVFIYLGIYCHQLIQTHIRHLLGYNRFNPQLTTADYDNDGDLDFVVGDNSGKIELWLNDGQGNFESEGVLHRYGFLSWGLASADFDGDGNIDFLVGALDTYLDYYSGNIWLKKNQLNP